MIPRPPHDPGLPSVVAAFDGEAMAEIFTAHLPDCVAGRFAVISCRPHYVRYKPGTNCIVQYALTLHDGAGSTVELPAHVHLYADDRAARRSRKARLQRLVESAARLHPMPPLGRAAHLPALRALACLYPVDYGLPALALAASASAMRAALLPILPEGAGRPTDAASALVRYKPARKAMLRIPLDGGSLDAVYAKLLDDDRGPALIEVSRSLLAAGVATAAPLAYLPDERLIVHAAAPGQPLSVREDVATFGRWMEPAAAALAGLHATDLPGLPEHRLADEAATMRAVAKAIGALLPALAPQLERLAGAIGNGLSALPDQAVPVHGDFYDDQVLVSESGVVLIDFDEIRRGHPLLDVGTFLAHLSVAGLEETRSMDGAHAAFRDAYARLRPAAASDVALFESAALLRKASGPFRRLEPNWPDAVARLVELTERCLARCEAGPMFVNEGMSSAGNVFADPALPQLGHLTDPVAMTAELRRVFGAAPVALRAIDVVRHKRGRRCVLRYDLEIGESPERRERLYGKTFASERGARVHAVTRAIVEARGFGPDVRLPEPVAFIPHLKLLLQREAPGEPVAPRLLVDDVSLAERMAEAVHALHGSGLDLGRRHGPDDELEPLHARVDQIGECCPALAAPAARCLALVETGRPRMSEWRWLPCHRDCYHDQFLIGPAGLAVLDLDDAAMSEPAVDVANVLAHLRLLGLQMRDDPAALAPAATAFKHTACRLDPGLDQAVLRFLEGATLLRLAAIHLPRARGEWLAARLLKIAESRLVAPVAAFTV